MAKGYQLADGAGTLKAYETAPAHWLGRTRQAGDGAYDCVLMQSRSDGLAAALTALDELGPAAALPAHERQRLLWLGAKEYTAPTSVFVFVRTKDRTKTLKALAPHLNAVHIMAASATADPVGAGDQNDPRPPRQTALPAKTVFRRKAIFGIIDDEIGFLNSRFCTRQGGAGDGFESRIQAIWRQQAPRAGGVHLDDGPVIRKPQIDDMLAQIARGETTEAALYAKLNRAGPPFQKGLASVSHGTHVLDLAAGFDPDHAPDIPIFAVDMPPVAISEPSRRIGAPYLVQGVRWLIQSALAHVEALNAAALAQPDADGAVIHWVPDIVLNCSIGSFAGPKDGTGLYTRLIGEELDLVNAMATDPALGPGYQYRATLFQSFGNAHASQQSAFHASTAMAGPLDWVLPRDDTASSTLETRVTGAEVETVWLRIGETDLEIPPLAQHSFRDIESEAGVIACLYREADERAQTGAARALYRLIVGPTVRLDQTDLPWMPAGPLRVVVQCTGPADVLWQVERDDVPFGYSGAGGQSMLRDPFCGSYAPDARAYTGLPSASAVQREGTETAEAHSPHPHIVTVGATAGDDTQGTPQPASYSAAGSETAAISTRKGPDVSATGDEPAALWGVLASGTFSGSTTRLSGTSIAAPQAARRMLMTAQKPAQIDPETPRIAQRFEDRSGARPSRTY